MPENLLAFLKKAIGSTIIKSIMKTNNAIFDIQGYIFPKIKSYIELLSPCHFFPPER